ncbi:hypothetical protein [Mariluticola halotolerans]|uniref:hypothetical protein n=1 Tax=Mariluticola halotolerans TaxID=2909283 RepID=UPI0026E47FC4|nr:hypothetical protein [Mariluticola halotolerans]UJQ95843.1 hypothetical protein L1P08_07620 [Mariluticola halotolerans]
MKIAFGGQGMRRAIRVVGILAVAGALSGCGMGSFMGGGDPSITGATNNNLADAATSQAAIAQAAPSALPAIATECPPIKVRNGGESVFSYANKKIGDPRELQFQAVIDKQSRNCVVSNGLITVKMGVVGRLLLGPAGEQKDFTLPLRFAVERDQQAIFSEKYDIPVQVTPPNQSEEFVKVVENVAIPYVGGEDITIWVGFDPRS